jgi:hypothetical protein
VITSSIAGAAAFFSIYGLAQIFSGTFWAVVLMGTSLEAGKLVTASFLYRYWPKISTVLKIYLVTAVLVLMFITSMGIFGFLSKSYQTDSLPLKEMQVKIDGLKQEQASLISRKSQLDAARQTAITAAVNNQSTKYRVLGSKERLSKVYDNEVSVINKRIPVLTNEIQELNQQILTTQLHTGPITYIAAAFGKEIDDATKWVILLIITAFDPLAVALTIGVNIAVNIRKSELDQSEKVRVEKERQDKIDQLNRERQDRIDTRDEMSRKREEELEDMRANLQHEKDMESLRHITTLSDSEPLINAPVELSPPTLPTDTNEMTEVIPATQPDDDVDNDAVMGELQQILNDITTKTELTPEELQDKRQIESILARRQLVDSMRGADPSIK